MSNTTNGRCPLPSATLGASWRIYAEGIPEVFTTIGVLSGLYGVLAVLSALSIHALIRRNPKAQPTAVALCLTIIALFASTTTHVVATLLRYQTTLLNTVLTTNVLWSYDVPIDTLWQTKVVVKDYSPIQSCAGTVALTINVILGDAIVCWRTCVVWQDRRAVKLVCGLFLLATLILGVIDTAQGCRSALFFPTQMTYLGTPIGSMFVGLPAGIAACVLSLSTNVLATALVGYKAWESRRRLKKYLAASTRASQVEKLFSLLIESGAVYSAIWAVIVVWQVGEYKSSSASPTMIRFLDIFGIVVQSALLPTIAIYPAFIIVLVALRRSHVEKALTPDDVPTPHISLSLGTISTSHRDSGTPSQMYEVLVLEPRAVRTEDSLDDASRNTGTSEEQSLLKMRAQAEESIP